MAQQHYRTPFKKALLQFITEPDPFLAMLKWVMTEMMRIEAEAKVGAVKGKHSSERATSTSPELGPGESTPGLARLIFWCPRSGRVAMSHFSSRNVAGLNKR